jgi:hypothetical protein
VMDASSPAIRVKSVWKRGGKFTSPDGAAAASHAHQASPDTLLYTLKATSTRSSSIQDIS